MKRITLIMILALISTASLLAQKTMSITSTTFTVNGNCGMCKGNIEKAAKKAGATTASWSEATHVLAVKYNSKKTNTKKLQDAIAKAGYDNIGATAPQSAYDKLHSCCKYDRATETKTDEKAVDEKGGTTALKACCKAKLEKGETACCMPETANLHDCCKKSIAAGKPACCKN
jgi:periplasmic mercuric ion binding protein